MEENNVRTSRDGNNVRTREKSNPFPADNFSKNSIYKSYSWLCVGIYEDQILIYFCSAFSAFYDKFEKKHTEAHTSN